MGADEVLGALGVPASTRDVESVLSVLRSDSDVREFLRDESLVEPSGSESKSYLVPRTRIFINRRRAKELRGDVYAAAAVWAVSQSVTWSAAVPIFRKLVHTLRVLDDRELDVLAVIAGVSARDGQPVATERILAAYEGNDPGVQPILSRMKDQGVIAQEAAGWVVTP
jgi:hypothetical protein